MKRIFTNRDYEDGYETIDLAPGGYLLWSGRDGWAEFSFPIDVEDAARIFTGTGRTFDAARVEGLTKPHPFA